MANKILKVAKSKYQTVINSIAFLPAIISVCFVLLSMLMLEIDFSEKGKNIKSQLSWLSLRDASTARSILTTIAGGIISLTVFSFSMVMILLNQVASQMTNRMLDSMIGNRFQQIVLGFYIGTITYSLFLLSTIRDISSGVSIPALSIYLLLVLTVFDIFLFIYFLHYVTQSIKFETIIKRIHDKTLVTLKNSCCDEESALFTPQNQVTQTISVPESNYYQGLSANQITHFAKHHDIFIHVLEPVGTYLLQDTPLITVSGKTLTKEEIQELMVSIDLHGGQPIDKTAYYGYHQLTEIAIKALSPGINDPKTAVLSMHALADLFRFRLFNYLPTTYSDENKVIRISTRVLGFEELFAECFNPIWDYGKDDRYVQAALLQMTEQLLNCDSRKENQQILQQFKLKVESNMKSS